MKGFEPDILAEDEALRQIAECVSCGANDLTDSHNVLPLTNEQSAALDRMDGTWFEGQLRKCLQEEGKESSVLTTGTRVAPSKTSSVDHACNMIAGLVAVALSMLIGGAFYSQFRGVSDDEIVKVDSMKSALTKLNELVKRPGFVWLIVDTPAWGSISEAELFQEFKLGLEYRVSRWPEARTKIAWMSRADDLAYLAENARPTDKPTIGESDQVRKIVHDRAVVTEVPKDQVAAVNFIVWASSEDPNSPDFECETMVVYCEDPRVGADGVKVHGLVTRSKAEAEIRIREHEAIVGAARNAKKVKKRD